MHHLETVTRDTPSWSAISVCSIPERYNDLPMVFFCSISAFVIKTFVWIVLKTTANMPFFRQAGKEVCNAFTDVCNRFTLSLKAVLNTATLHQKAMI